MDESIRKSEESLNTLGTGIINKIARYTLNKEHQKDLDRKEDYVKKYLNGYFSWMETQFVTLKLPKELLDELKKSTLIAMKFDMLKPILLLDNLIEKISIFLWEGKQLKGKEAFSVLIDKSVDDFMMYIQKQIEVMNQYKNNSYVEEKLISKEMEDDIEKIKKQVFAD